MSVTNWSLLIFKENEKLIGMDLMFILISLKSFFFSSMNFFFVLIVFFFFMFKYVGRMPYLNRKLVRTENQFAV